MDEQQTSIQKLDHHISLLQYATLSLSRSHPWRVHCVQGLAIARHQRFTLSGQQNDLKQAILRYTEAIFHPPPRTHTSLNIVQILFLITDAFSLLANRSRQPEDVKWSITYLRYLHDQPLEAFDLFPNSVTKFLVDELSLQVMFSPGDVSRDIEEMAILCQELIKSDISKASLTVAITALVNASYIHLSTPVRRSELSNKVIECLQDANRCLPDLQPVSVMLAQSLYNRFEITLSNDDYEEGTTILEKIIAFPDPKDRTSQSQALRLIALFTAVQSNKCGKTEYVEKEICRFRDLLAGASLEDPARPVIDEVLTFLKGQRRDDFGVKHDLRDAHPTAIDSELSSFPPLPPFRDLIASLSQPSSHESSIVTDLQHLSALLSSNYITEMADIEDAIEYYRLLRASFYSSNPFATLAGKSLGKVLRQAFLCTNKIDYLDQSITAYQDILATLAESFDQYAVVLSLIESLYTRYTLIHSEEDLDEIMRLHLVTVNNRRVKAPNRFEVACRWAMLARQFGHSSIPTAYGCAISLMQDALTFAPTLDLQHFRLVALRFDYEVLPLDYASHLVHTNQLDEAIETLEHGRALLWSEMRGLRTSIDRLRAADSDLADKFAAINGDLETLTLTISSNTDHDAGDGGLEDMDRIGLLLLRQRELLDEREWLISKVRSLQGFASFLKAPSIGILRQAAFGGPVIVINHSKWRSDIIILIHDSPPSLITTTDDFYGRAIECRDRLVNCRNSMGQGLDSKQYQRHLRSVLESLYDLVGRPVIERFQSLNVPEQSRVWWCPTSVFCSLPLHAMGPIPSSDGRKRYFMDLYIPSYTPTLSALIDSRKPSNQEIKKPSILLVAQPDQSLLEASPEISVIQQLNMEATTLMSNQATPSAVVKGLRDHQFSHFVCHGKLEHGKPFDASFQLHEGQRLTLLDLIRSQLPTAEFAFLSACHTAEMTEGSIADEALHLTAAMQHCGFRSVVGTMWGMADADGPGLVEHFYKSMFSNKESGIPYYERSAEALRDAVQQLRRKKRMNLERWVNFVHYGA
ncbi:CHAT domain-containing protein [Russula earlei]|uniref:CHAT domain-containing protein n=1 Tax=Russula earlei TaxID=71964 RepID=A0ACC0UGC3_9AGAM|nr:CHAT domain-containing protein [Russula earlei]